MNNENTVTGQNEQPDENSIPVPEQEQKMNEKPGQETGIPNNETGTAKPMSTEPEKEKKTPLLDDRDDTTKNNVFKATDKLELSFNFGWIGKRDETASIIGRFLQTRVLFIQSPDIDLIHLATQRLVTTLFVLRKMFFDSPIHVRISKEPKQLPPSFWKEMEKPADPCFVILHFHYYDHLKSLLLKDNFDVDEVKRSLNEKNIFLICIMPESAEVLSLLDDWRAVKNLESIYTRWEIPSVRIELVRKYGKAGLNAFENIKDLPQFNDMKESTRYQVLKKIQGNTAPENIPDEFIKIAGEHVNMSEKGTEELASLIKGNDFIIQTMIFTAAFFPGIDLEDFRLLVSILLGDVRSADIYNKEGEKKEAPFLKDTWNNRAATNQYFQKSFLTIREQNEQEAVVFSASEMNENIRRIIKTECPIISSDAFKHLAFYGILFDPAISSMLRRSVIRFIVMSAQKSKACQETDWLLRLFIMNLREVLLKSLEHDSVIEDIIKAEPELTQDYLIAKILVLAAANVPLRNSIADGLSLLFSDMLNVENKVFNRSINEFIRKLVGLYSYEKTSLDIVLPIYSKILKDNDFLNIEKEAGVGIEKRDDQLSRAGLIRYFSMIFEQSNHQQMFDAYSKMLNYFGRWDLFRITNEWLRDKTISDKSRTKKISWLFQLDFCIYSFDRHFRKKETELYELFSAIPAEDGNNHPEFSDDLELLLRNITCKDFIEACTEVLRHKNFLALRIYWLEHDITGLEPGENRFEKFTETHTLAGDIIENWFFILSSDEINMSGIEPAAWQNFGEIVYQNADPGILASIIRYWSAKVNIYSNSIIDMGKLNMDKEKITKDKNTLKLRRSCIRKLTEIILNNKKNNSYGNN